MTGMPTVESRTRRTIFIDLLFAAMVLLFVSLSFSAARQESVTIDEFRHLSTAVHYWQSGDYSFDAATPPLWKMAMALPAWLAGAKTVQFQPLPAIAAGWEPWFVATDFMRANGAAYSGYLQSARLVNIMAAALCLSLLYLRCRRRFGGEAALFGTAFLAFSPTFLAHSHYATTDVIATLTLLGVVFLLSDYLHRPGALRLACAALLVAVSLLCKFTALLLIPLLLLTPLLAVLGRRGDARPVRLFALVSSLLLVVVMLLLAINIFYGFEGSGTALQQMRLESRALTSLSQSVLGSLPLPLPRAFVEGFDKQKADSDFAEFPAYFMGRWSEEGFRSYYLAAFCLKESIPFILLIAAALFVLARQGGRPLGRAELLLLLYVPVTLLVVLSCLNRLNIGVRYLLPVYPYLCLFVAGLYGACRGRRGVPLVLLLLLVVHLVSVFRVSPHYLSYFNEFAGGAANGYRYLIDSNIDWGQDLPSLKKFMADHAIAKIQLAYFGHGLPELYGINYEPLSLPAKPGYVAISVSLLQGQPYLLTYTKPLQFAEAGQYLALKQLRPVGRAGYSILIYKID